MRHMSCHFFKVISRRLIGIAVYADFIRGAFFAYYATGERQAGPHLWPVEINLLGLLIVCPRLFLFLASVLISRQASAFGFTVPGVGDFRCTRYSGSYFCLPDQRQCLRGAWDVFDLSDTRPAFLVGAVYGTSLWSSLTSSASKNGRAASHTVHFAVASFNRPFSFKATPRERSSYHSPGPSRLFSSPSRFWDRNQLLALLTLSCKLFFFLTGPTRPAFAHGGSFYGCCTLLRHEPRSNP